MAEAFNTEQYINRAITAFKLGWSKESDAYSKFMERYTLDERHFINKLIMTNERKWIARYRNQLEDYTPTLPVIEGDKITDIDGVEVFVGDLLDSLNGSVLVELVLLPTEKESQYFLKCVRSEEIWNDNDGILPDNCLSNWRKIERRQP